MDEISLTLLINKEEREAPIMRKAFITLTVAAGIFVLLYSGTFESKPIGDDRGRDYIIKKGDSLGRLAERYYKDARAYRAIIEGTNRKAGYDRSYQVIRNANDVSYGQKIWIPTSANLRAQNMRSRGDDKYGDDRYSDDRWGYQGMISPAHWGRLDSEYKKCDKGRKQSPIDISSKRRTMRDDMEFHYKPSRLKMMNDGRTINVNYDQGSKLIIDGHVYYLKGFNFHAPSEHTIDSVATAMEMQLVHRDRNGKVAVVGVLFELGQRDNPFLAKFWNRLPTKGNEIELKSEVNVASLFNTIGEKYNYEGSLTTPPCTEDVDWYIVKKKERLSKSQLAKFVALIGLNARPTQELNRR